MGFGFSQRGSIAMVKKNFEKLSYDMSYIIKPQYTVFRESPNLRVREHVHARAYVHSYRTTETFLPHQDSIGLFLLLI